MADSKWDWVLGRLGWTRIVAEKLSKLRDGTLSLRWPYADVDEQLGAIISYQTISLPLSDVTVSEGSTLGGRIGSTLIVRPTERALGKGLWEPGILSYSIGSIESDFVNTDRRGWVRCRLYQEVAGNGWQELGLSDNGRRIEAYLTGEAPVPIFPVVNFTPPRERLPRGIAAGIPEVVEDSIIGFVRGGGQCLRRKKKSRKGRSKKRLRSKKKGTKHRRGTGSYQR